MQTTKENSSTKRPDNHHAVCYHIRNLMGTSYGQPVHLRFYLHPLMNAGGKTDREKIVELFNAENYG
ncbi:MAG: hypothetical protein LBR08_08245 [Bacteroidales bacterium]|jgi:hypothetical protein|nr:hypothetical protein [Bacteroidales bacterium]